MANAELYKQVNGIAITGHTLGELQGISVIPRDTPFKYGHIPAFSYVSANGTMAEDPRILRGRLVQISPNHCRSFELRFGCTARIYWSDQYGNIFSSLTTKGNNLDNPRVEENSLAPSGYRVWGLQDSDAIVRILRASELLRTNNIPAEMIVRVIEPLELPYNGELVTLEELKRSLLTQIWEQNAEQDSDSGAIPREDIPEVSEALDKMTFYITVRGLQVPERLQDFALAKSKEDFQAMSRRVFAYVNRTDEMKARRDPSYSPCSLDAENKEDVSRYFLEYLPGRAASNLARMHNLDLVHWFPTAGNISAVGSIYDLDSVRGKPLSLGEDEITDADAARDVQVFLHGEDTNGVSNILNLLKKRGFVADKPFARFKRNFCLTYVQERGWDTDLIGNISRIYMVMDSFKRDDDKEMLAYFVERVNGQMDWSYHHPQAPEEFLTWFFRSWTDVLRAGADELVEKMLEGVQEGEEPQEKATTTIVQEFDSFAREEFRRCSLSHVSHDLDKNHEPELKRLKVRYGEKNAPAIVGIIARSESNRLVVTDPAAFAEQEANFLKEYLHKFSLDLFTLPEISQIEDKLGLGGYTGRLLVKGGRSVKTFGNLPITEYLKILSSTNESLTITAFTSHPPRYSPYAVLIGEAVSRPRYLLTDGQVIGIDRSGRLLPSTWVIEDNSYVAWISEKAVSDNPSNYYIQTKLKASELRKVLGKIKNIQLRCQRFT